LRFVQAHRQPQESEAIGGIPSGALLPSLEAAVPKGVTLEYVEGEPNRFMGMIDAFVGQVIHQRRCDLAKEAGGAGRKLSRPPTPGGKGANGRSRAREARR
jgi:hypothetical protein